MSGDMNIRRRADAITAGYLETAGNIVSGLHLDPIGEDGHAVANLLWKIAAHLRRREDAIHEVTGEAGHTPSQGEDRT